MSVHMVIYVGFYER